MPESEGDRFRRATLADVAKKAGVSSSAVSRAFTPGASVSSKTRQRVLAAADQLGFQPNVLARSLMTGRSALIALVTNAFANPFINSVVDVFTSELQRRNLRPMVFNLKGDFNRSHTINMMRQYQIDGVIVATSTIDLAFMDSIQEARIPMVQAFGRYLGDRETDTVFVDNVGGGRVAARELLARGYRKPAFIGAEDSISTSLDRLTGFREALRSQGLDPVVVRSDGYSYAAGRSSAATLFATNPDIDSIFCADDLLGIGVMDALRSDLGRTCPETGVIGFNDIDVASWASHPLATFSSDNDLIVVNAINMLEARINQPSKPGEQRVVTCRFVERASVRKKVED